MSQPLPVLLLPVAPHRQGREAELTAFRDAVLADLDDLADLCRTYDLEVTSLYVGGGTPTCLPLPVLEAMMTRLTRNFPAAREWTVEAGRPDTATPDMLAMLRQAGVDRISVNPQTLQQHLLDALGRRHRVEDIYTMYENCRKLGFSVINMDFIAGLPGKPWQICRKIWKLFANCTRKMLQFIR